LATFVFH